MNVQATIPSTAKRIDYFTPPSLKGQPNETAFGLRVATPSERDTIGTRLFRMGITSVDESLIRATTIDVLYDMDWGKGSPEANEAHADVVAGQLESYWLRTEAEQQAIALWNEREQQRILDAAAPDGVERESEPPPQGLIKPRERSQMRLLSDRIARESSRIRDLMSKRLEFAKTNDRLLCRIHIVSIAVDSGSTAPKLDYDEEGILTEESLDEIRERIGDQAYRELVTRIDAQYSLPEDERKNSDSPLEKPLPPNGSTEPSDDLASSAGSSTE